MRIFITTIPKSGTHLAVEICRRLHAPFTYSLSKHHVLALRRYSDALLYDTIEKFQKNILLYGHFRIGDFEDLANCLRRLAYRIIVLIRDPADVVLSLRDYYIAGLDVGLRPVKAFLEPMSEKEQFETIIAGFRIGNIDMKGIVEHCRGFCEWGSGSPISIIRYEDLMAEKLTGDVLASLALSSVDTQAVEEAILSCRGRTSLTFNVGVVGRGQHLGLLSAPAARALEAARESLGYGSATHDPQRSF